MSIQNQEVVGKVSPEQRMKKSLSISPKVVKIGERLAAAENRHFSNYVETLILKDAAKGESKTETHDSEEKEDA